jgi:hypothetical protein
MPSCGPEQRKRRWRRQRRYRLQLGVRAYTGTSDGDRVVSDLTRGARYREVTVTVEDATLPWASVASALRVYGTREVLGTVQAQE